MKTYARGAALTSLLTVVVVTSVVLGQDAKVAPPSTETLVTGQGTTGPGRIEGGGPRGFRFADATGKSNRLEPGMTVQFDGRGSSASAGQPPYRLELGLGQRLCGRLGSVGERDVVLYDTAGEGKMTVSRAGVNALLQRPGESLVFHDGFESLDTTRWKIVGEAELSGAVRVEGGRSLRIPSDGASLTHRLGEPFVSGRVEVAFHDPGTRAERSQWFVDLTFRGAAGPETLRAVLGWAEESLAVESPGGPALAVQRLARKPGWHRLSIRFTPALTEVAVDANELAHGKGFGGALTEIRLASFETRTNSRDDGDELAGHFDDLRLIKFFEPVGDIEVDVTQDEVRLVGGDQLFGAVQGADGDRVRMSVAGRPVVLPWGDVAALSFRRVSAPARAVEGLLVRAGWRSAHGDDPRDLNVVEGALVEVTPESLTLEAPYAGRLVVPRGRMTVLEILGRGRRIVVDPKAHHLGDEISTMPPLIDPPQPEGGTLERSFGLEAVPDGPSFLVLDVVQVVGENADVPTFSDMVKRGELRTNVKINGEPFDYLNRHVQSRNEAPERIRIPLPHEHLRAGKNVVRFEQVGTANDPNYLDDLGILTIAVEFPNVTPPAPDR